jgi:hypothetical protein
MVRLFIGQEGQVMDPGLESPTREGGLIRHARELAIPKLSIRAAAAKAGISPENWGHVERGYQSAGRGQEPRRVVPPAATLARMAYAVGVSPLMLNGIGRADAAGMLHDILDREHPGTSHDSAWTPAAMFVEPGDRVQRALWDLQQLGVSENVVRTLIAVYRSLSTQEAQARHDEMVERDLRRRA